MVSDSTPRSLLIASTTIDGDHLLAASELAHLCDAQLEWVIQLVQTGIVEADARERAPDDWHFNSAALHCALEARQLERRFGIDLDAAALIIDLQREVRRLRAHLHAQGLNSV